MKKIVLMFTLVVFAFAFASCSEETTTAAATTGAETTTAAPQVLNWNIGADPQTLDPGLNGASDGGDVINQTFEGLVREVGGVVNPGIAESWETSSDGLTVTFHLRESNWSDGTPLTASDFVYAWKRGMDPATASEYSWIWEYTNIVGALDAVYEGGSLDDVGITAVNDTTLEVELLYPTPYFVSLMAFYHFMPVKQASVEDPDGAEGLWAKDPDLAVCNGPFKLVEYSGGEGLKLVKNDEYWNADEVYLSEINGKFIDIETTAYAGYYAGELDVIPNVPTSLIPTFMVENPEFKVFKLIGTYYYNFNMADEDDTWDNLNLRKALILAIDREAITTAMSSGEVPATSFVPNGFLDNNGDDFAEVFAADYESFDIPTDDSGYTDAVAYFEDAADDLGMTVAELQTALEGKVILYNTSESHEMVATMVQASWSEVLGIDLDLQNQDWAVFQDTRENGDYDIARGGWVTDFMDPSGLLAIFVSDNAYNDPKYVSQDYDDLLEAAQATTDLATHFTKLYEAQEILMQDLPIIPVYHYTDTYLIKDYVTGWGRSVLGSLDFTHAEVEG